jgi:hypothetical protein
MVCTPEPSTDSDGKQIPKCNHIPYGCPTCKPKPIPCVCHTETNKNRQLQYVCPICQSESGQPDGSQEGPSPSST